MFWVSYVFLKTRINRPLIIDHTMQSRPLAQIYSNFVNSIYGHTTPDIDLLCQPIVHLAVASDHATPG